MAEVPERKTNGNTWLLMWWYTCELCGSEFMEEKFINPEAYISRDCRDAGCTGKAFLLDSNTQEKRRMWYGNQRPVNLMETQNISDGFHELIDELDEIDNDPVNHPSHYTSHPSGIECIDITRHMNFNLGNALKYVWRAGLKDADAEIQDLEKAIWYIQDEINRRK